MGEGKKVCWGCGMIDAIEGVSDGVIVKVPQEVCTNGSGSCEQHLILVSHFDFVLSEASFAFRVTQLPHGESDVLCLWEEVSFSCFRWQHLEQWCVWFGNVGEL